MHAYDFTIVAPHSKGSLANLAEELGREKINIEGLFAVEQNGSAAFHLLTTDKAATMRAITKVGYKVTRETEVIVEHIEDRPGMLGKVTRHLADAGINLTTMYLATDTRLVLGCENISAIETAWKDLAAVASR
ncbi:MAG: ACT domain-containing protein [Candidatus Dormiibacterota bacterium]